MAAKFSAEQVARFNKIRKDMASSDPEVVQKAKEEWAKFVVENEEVIREATNAYTKDSKPNESKSDDKKDGEGWGWKKTVGFGIGAAALAGGAYMAYRHFANGGEVEAPPVEIPTSEG